MLWSSTLKRISVSIGSNSTRSGMIPGKCMLVALLILNRTASFCMIGVVEMRNSWCSVRIYHCYFKKVYQDGVPIVYYISVILAYPLLVSCCITNTWDKVLLWLLIHRCGFPINIPLRAGTKIPK